MATALELANDRLHVELDEKHVPEKGSPASAVASTAGDSELHHIHSHAAPSLPVLIRLAARARAREAADVTGVHSSAEAGPGSEQ